jgi:SAM-dependent methyltransferase
MAEPLSWEDSQEYELDFWVNRWPYRDKTRQEVLRIRLEDAHWFLGSFGFKRTAASGQFHGFGGNVLEVGCGPVGFFELVWGVEVTGQDPLMQKYAERMPNLARFGVCGRYNYTADAVAELPASYYDYVVCSNVLDHTGDWRLALGGMLDRLKVGGRLLLYTQCRDKPVRGHTQTFTPAMLLDAVTDLDDMVCSMRTGPDTKHGAVCDCYVDCTRRI